MSTIDIGRIERARENRRKQLEEWERFDKEDKLKPKKRRGPRVMFGSGTVFFEAAARDDFDEVKRLLEEGVNPDVQNEDGLTALHQCCINNSIDMSELLLDHGANVNATDKELWTPLHAAATCGHKDLCDLLIKRGADLLALNIDGNMPYDLCEDDDTLMLVESQMAARDVTQEQIDEIRLRPEREMLEDLEKRRVKGDDFNQLDSQGAAPIHIACACGYVEVARFLLECRVDPQIPDIDGWLPIHIAVCWAQMEIVELLVAYGADMNLPTQSGQTVYTISDSKELRDHLVDIWAKREELRKGVALPTLGFQNARASGRRRSSVVPRRSKREKRDLTLMDARLEKQLGEQEEAKIVKDMSEGIDCLPLSPPFAPILPRPAPPVPNSAQESSPDPSPPPLKASPAAGMAGQGQQVTNFNHPELDQPVPPRVSQPKAVEASRLPNNTILDSEPNTMPPRPPPRAKKAQNGAPEPTKSRTTPPHSIAPTSSTSANSSSNDSIISTLDKPPTGAKKTLMSMARGSGRTSLPSATAASPSSSSPVDSTEQAAKQRRIPPRDYKLSVTDERTSLRRIVNGSGQGTPNHTPGTVTSPSNSAAPQRPEISGSETLRTDALPNHTPSKATSPSNGQQATVEAHRSYSAQPTASPAGHCRSSTTNFPRSSGCCRLM